MTSYYTHALVTRIKGKGTPAWQGILRHMEPNPAYVEDTREPWQRRKAYGKTPNPNYVPDTRTPLQRKRNVQKEVRKVFDPQTVRTKTQANAALAEWRERMEAEHAAPNAGMGVSVYVGRYIDTREGLGTITPSTVHDYRGSKRYFSRGGDWAIANTPLRDLTPAQVQQWELALIRSGLSGQTVLKAHRLLKMVCKYALEIGDLPASPVRGFKAPQGTTGKPNALDAEGRRVAIVALEKMGTDPVAVAAQIALYTGMRRGEVCALTWGNVDLKGMAWTDTNEQGPKIRVTQAFGDAEGGEYLKGPKTARGNRIIPISGGLLDLLRKRRAEMWRKWAEAMQEARVVPRTEMFNALYVIGYVGGEHMRPDTLTTGWKRFSTREGLTGTEGKRITFHDLRHSYATNAVTRNVDVSSVSANMGHAQVSTTLNMYASRDSAAQREASRVVALDLDSARNGEVLPFTRQANGTEG